MSDNLDNLNVNDSLLTEDKQDIILSSDSSLDDDVEDYYNTGSPIEDKETLLKQLFNTDNRIEILRRSLRGETPRSDGTWVKLPKELAGDEFINKQMCSFRAIVNDINTFTKKNDKECKRILKDSVDAFILDTHGDETVETKDIRTLSKMYEHALELFLGLVEFGHGAKVLNAALTGKSMNLDNEQHNKQRSFMDWVKDSK